MQQPKLKMLYGRDLKDYENMNVEDLLTQLSAEELEELSGTVDPDDSLLPPSQRCKEQTNKDPTGPLNRRQLLNFLTKFAKEQEDWPEDKKFVPGVKLGKRLLPIILESQRPMTRLLSTSFPLSGVIQSLSTD